MADLDRQLEQSRRYGDLTLAQLIDRLEAAERALRHTIAIAEDLADQYAGVPIGEYLWSKPYAAAIALARNSQQ